MKNTFKLKAAFSAVLLLSTPFVAASEDDEMTASTCNRRVARDTLIRATAGATPSELSSLDSPATSEIVSSPAHRYFDIPSFLSFITELNSGNFWNKSNAGNLCETYADHILRTGTLSQKNDFFRRFAMTYLGLNKHIKAARLLESFSKTHVLEYTTNVLYTELKKYIIYDDAAQLIDLGQRENEAAHFHRALLLLGEDGDKKLRAEAYVGLGRVHDGEDRGTEHFKKALRLLGEDGDTKLEIQAHIGLGRAHEGLESSLEHFQRALHLLDKYQNENLKRKIYLGLGKTNCSLGKNIAGITWYYKAFSECGFEAARNFAMFKRHFVQSELMRTEFESLESIEKEALLAFFKGDVDDSIRIKFGLKR